MYIQTSDEFKHHVETFGEHKNFGCKDWICPFPTHYPKFKNRRRGRHLYILTSDL